MPNYFDPAGLVPQKGGITKDMAQVISDGLRDYEQELCSQVNLGNLKSNSFARPINGSFTGGMSYGAPPVPLNTPMSPSQHNVSRLCSSHCLRNG